jgi:hypothetical protein
MRIEAALVLVALPSVACAPEPEPEPEPKSSAPLSSAHSAEVAETRARPDDAIAVVSNRLGLERAGTAGTDRGLRRHVGGEAQATRWR